jgi:hypothetical protein
MWNVGRSRSQPGSFGQRDGGGCGGADRRNRHAAYATVAARILADPHALAIGARGLGQALAKHLAKGTGCVVTAAFEFPLMIACVRVILTIRQMEHVTRVRGDVTDVAAPNGEVRARR